MTFQGWAASMLGGLIVVFSGPSSAAPSKCNRDTDCKGEVCLRGRCQSCRSDRRCPRGQSCNKGKCRSGPQCWRDAHCGLRGKCRMGKCFANSWCRTDADCRDGRECVKQMCGAPSIPPTGDRGGAARPRRLLDMHTTTTMPPVKTRGDRKRCLSNCASSAATHLTKPHQAEKQQMIDLPYDEKGKD